MIIYAFALNANNIMVPISIKKPAENLFIAYRVLKNNLKEKQNNRNVAFISDR